MTLNLLFLSHRIPYPPDKGDKIRSWHLLRHLAQQWRVHLGAFVDDPDDWRHAPMLEALCADVKLRGISTGTRKLHSLKGLLTGEALSLPYYRDAELAAWVDAKLMSGIDGIVVYSSAMAQFVILAEGKRRIMDFVDIDSDKWLQYAQTKSWPNVDAVTWFAREVLPEIRQRFPDVVFYIVGSSPGPEVIALANEAVMVTGRVEDVRPYLAHAAAVVAPLRIARGIQNKVLEAMAMAKTVVSSPQALEGIAACLNKEILSADTPASFVSAIEQALQGFDCGQAARARVVADYSWESSLSQVDILLNGVGN